MKMKPAHWTRIQQTLLRQRFRDLQVVQPKLGLSNRFRLTSWKRYLLRNNFHFNLFDENQMDYLFDQLRDKETGLKRRDIGAFNRTKECFKG